MSRSSAPPALEVLRCRACGAPLPLGTADTARCGHCGGDTPLPEAYVALRRSRARGEAERRRAARALARLGRPASTAVRVAAAILDLPAFLFFLLYAAPVTAFVTSVSFRAGDAYAAWAHLGPRESVPFPLATAFVGALLTATVFAPRAFGLWANRVRTARTSLLEALAARPPSAPGGVAECRACGAPLEIEPGELVAGCAYCGAESVLRPDAPATRSARRAAHALGARIEDALATDREERRATRLRFFRELGRYVGYAAVALATFVLQSAFHRRTAVVVATSIVNAGLLLYVLFWPRADDDAAERRTDDLPRWVGPVGGLCVSVAALWGVFHFL